MQKYLIPLLALLFIAITVPVASACSAGSAVTALEASPLLDYSLVPTAGIEAVGEIDLLGLAVGVGAPVELAVQIGHKPTRAILYQHVAKLRACSAIVLRAAGQGVELVHLQGQPARERFPFLECGAAAGPDAAPLGTPDEVVLWRDR